MSLHFKSSVGASFLIGSIADTAAAPVQQITAPRNIDKNSSFPVEMPFSLDADASEISKPIAFSQV